MRYLISAFVLIFICPFALSKDQAAQKPADAKNGSPPNWIVEPGGHTGFVNKVFFTKDSKQVISASMDKTIRFWDVPTGDLIRTLRMPAGPGLEGGIQGASLSPDGTRLAVGGVPVGSGKLGYLIYVITVETGEVEKVLTGHQGSLWSLAFSPDGKRLASSSKDGTARLYDVETGKTIREFKGHTSGIMCVAFSPDGSKIATASIDSTAAIWPTNVDDPKPKILKGHRGECLYAAWNPKTGHLATCGADGSIRIWRDNGTFIKSYYDFPNDKRPIAMISLAYSLDGKWLLHTMETMTRLNDAEQPIGRGFLEHKNVVRHGAISPDGKFVVTSGGNNNEIYIWTTDNIWVYQKLASRGSSIWALGWSPDGKSIGWGNTNFRKTAKTDTPLEKTFQLGAFQLGDLPGDNFVRTVAKRDGYTLEAEGFTRLQIKREDNPPISYEMPKDKRLLSYTMLPDQKAVVAGTYTLALLDLKTNKVVRDFVAHTGEVYTVSASPDGRYFASAGDDQTIRFWRPDRSEPVMSLFIAGRDWVAWTPEGFYSASPNGEALLGWLVDRGPEKMAAYHPAAQLRAAYYQPALIRHLLPGGTIDKAKELAAKEIQPPTIARELENAVPPEVVLTAPAKSGIVRSLLDKIEIKAKAESTTKNPIMSMRLLINGRPYLGDRGLRTFIDPKPGSVETSWTVDIPPGRHTVYVLAETATSKGRAGPLEIFRDGLQTDPSLFIVATGVSNYAGDLKLNYAAADAKAIVKAFESHSKGVFKKVEARVLTDKEASNSGITEGLKWLAGKMTSDDVGIFFFSGHGTTDAKGNFFLVPIDVDSRNIAESCVSGDALKKSLANMPGRLILMLDACHSGAAADKLPPSRPDDLVRDLLSDEYGVVVMSSSLGREYSLESADTAAGYFTHGLVEGLSGKADLNRDQMIYIHELDRFAGTHVNLLSKGRQNPTTGIPTTIRSFPVARIEMKK